MPRGAGVRCAGFLSSDGAYIHCSREELAGRLRLVEGSNTYAHRAEGPCLCGAQHGAAPLLPRRDTAGGGTPRAALSATYNYQSAEGKLLFQVVRHADKSFRQRRPDGQGGWLWSLGEVARPLYRLPELLRALDAVVYVVEGEKDVDRLQAAGLTATCNPMGAGKWRPEHTAALAGRDVVILPDADAPGRAHGATIAAALSGVAARVRWLELAPARIDGYDVSDWLAEGHTPAELVALAAAAPEGGPPREPAESAEVARLRAQLAALEAENARLREESLAKERAALALDDALARVAGGDEPEAYRRLAHDHAKLAARHRNLLAILRDTAMSCTARVFACLVGEAADAFVPPPIVGATDPLPEPRMVRLGAVEQEAGVGARSASNLLRAAQARGHLRVRHETQREERRNGDASYHTHVYISSGYGIPDQEAAAAEKKREAAARQRMAAFKEKERAAAAGTERLAAAHHAADIARSRPHTCSRQGALVAVQYVCEACGTLLSADEVAGLYDLDGLAMEGPEAEQARVEHDQFDAPARVQHDQWGGDDPF
ncbi:MAG TPA: hypothetical protein VKT52_09280 [Ktedonobacterales bacterium]|nr:hypothetical protein [Ktedonobacterales bacterium]